MWERTFLISHLFIFNFQVIYGIRNPRDVLVSGYYFGKQMNIVKNPETLEQYIKLFLQGEGECAVQLRSCRTQSLPLTSLDTSRLSTSAACTSRFHPHCNTDLLYVLTLLYSMRTPDNIQIQKQKQNKTKLYENRVRSSATCL